MENAPDLQEASKRLNPGGAADERAWAAARAVDLARYEAERRTAFMAGVGALEWAVKHCLEQFYGPASRHGSFGTPCRRKCFSTIFKTAGAWCLRNSSESFPGTRAGPLSMA